jgi:hypothetical protein
MNSTASLLLNLAVWRLLHHDLSGKKVIDGDQ